MRNIIIGLASVGLAVTGCAAQQAAAPVTPTTPTPTRTTPAPTPTYVAPTSTRLEEARDICKIIGGAGRKYVSLADDGATMLVDTESENGSVEFTACVLSAIDTPDSTFAKMDGTTALQGVQTAKHDGFKMRWTYHPDNGFQLIVEDTLA